MNKCIGLFLLFFSLMLFGVLPISALAQSYVIISTITPTVELETPQPIATPTLIQIITQTEPTAAPPIADTPIITYTVVDGDTLYDIAAQYDTTAEYLAEINEISLDSGLYIGQELIVSGVLPLPKGIQIIENDALQNLSSVPSVPKIHRTTSGESLSVIAQTYQLSVEQLAEANRVTLDHQLQLGELVTIPGIEGELIGMTHEVAPGETLEQIALNYNTTTAALLQDQASLINPDHLPIGLKLPIVSRTGWNTPIKRFGRLHVVTPSDTLSAIAIQYDLSLLTLAQQNQIDLHAPILPGTRLFIPNPTSDTVYQEPLSPELATVQFNDTRPIQGQTLSVYAEPLNKMSNGRLTGSLRYSDYEDPAETWYASSYEQEVQFEPYEDGFIGLFGFDAFAPPGLYLLELMDDEQSTAPIFRQMLTVDALNYGFQSIPISDSVQIRVQENALLAPIYASHTTTRTWSLTTPLVAPIDVQYISAGYGAARSYAGQPVRIFHSGVDYAAPQNTPIKAVAGGTIVFSQLTTLRGNVVVIDHGWGVMSAYFHMAQRLVNVGDEVSVGSAVGSLGSTGLSTGPHLHWDVRVHGAAVDGLQWLSEPMLPTP